MTKIVSIPIELDEQDFTAEVIVTYTIDKNYGADADGRRGTERLFINNWDILEIIDEDGGEVFITDDMIAEVASKIYEVDLTEE